MTRVVRNLAAMGIIFSLLGCTVRTYEIEKPRKDLEITGNQGYLYGSPPPAQKPAETTRKVTVVEVEMGKPVRLKSKSQSVKTESIENIQEESLKEGNSSSVNETEFIPQTQEGEGSYKLYTVKKNDTLQKISRKFYNTTRKWKRIYDVNKDILKNPDDIKPGQVLKIP